MQLKRKILTLCCVAGALWGCARYPEAERAADLDEDVAVLLPDQPTDPAIVTAEPTMARTLYANDWVGAARVSLEPGELIPPHESGTRFVYAESDCTLSVIDNGTEEIVDMEPGEVVTWPAGRLGIANVGTSTAELLVVERSPVETSPDLVTLAIPDDAVEMERHGTVVLDDENVLAVDMRLEELEADPLPANLPMLIVALSDCDLEFQGPAVSDVEEVMRLGEAVWLDAGYGAVANVGEGEAHALVFALRK